MRRKRRRKPQRDNGGDSATNSFEEDLKQQRLKQKQREAEVRDANTSFEDDLKKQRLKQQDERGEVTSVGTPKSMQINPDEIIKHNQTLTSSQVGFLPIERYQHVASVNALYYAAACTQPSRKGPVQTRRQQLLLRHLWYGRYVLENILVNTQATSLYGSTEWRNFRMPGGINCPWDLASKFHLHPSARTFDVIMNKCDPQGQQKLPRIVSIVQGGFATYTNLHEQSSRRPIHTWKADPVQAIRFNHSDPEWFGTITRAKSRGAYHKFNLHRASRGATMLSSEIPDDMHDLCFSKDFVIFAPLERRTPLFLHMDNLQRDFDTMVATNFPDSDALRVEFNDKDKLAAFGHRNGQLSIFDIRQNFCSITRREQSTDMLGSVTDLRFLNNPAQMVLKRSFGCCQLIDLRMLETNHLVHKRGRKDANAAVIHTLSAPQGECHQTLSSNANGMVVDAATESIVMSPYISSQSECCVGTWSLATGQFLGKRVLPGGSKQNRAFVEFAQTITPAYIKSDNRKATVDAGSGFWIKCGNFSTTSPDSKQGRSLQHLHLPASYII